MRSSPARLTSSKLNSGEGGDPAAQRAAPSSGKAPRPMHEDGKRVRQLGTDGVTETEVRRGGGGLPEVNMRRWRGRDATVGSPYIAVHRVRLTRSCGVDGSGRRLDTASHGVHVRSRRSEVAVAWELREGHVRWCFVRMSLGR
jgi:hypothetical protein